MAKNKNIKSKPMEYEWTRLVETEDVLARKPYVKTITANEEECKNLARRMKVVAIDNLKADITLTRKENSHIIHVTGSLNADIVQLCVVSLDPLTDHVTSDIDGWFADETMTVSLGKARREREGKRGREWEIKDEQEDPETIDDGYIDIGELASQHLALSINPYPIKEGAEYEGPKSDDVKAESPDTMKNPFAALKDFKDRLKS